MVFKKLQGALVFFLEFLKNPTLSIVLSLLRCFFYRRTVLALERSYAIVIDNGTVVPRFRSRSSQNDHLKAGHLYCAEGEDFIVFSAASFG